MSETLSRTAGELKDSGGGGGGGGVVWGSVSTIGDKLCSLY